MKNKPNKTANIRNPNGTFKNGNPGSPGRPKGKTLKEFAREMLMSMSDEEKIKYLKALPPELVWRMSEGNPHQTSDTEAKFSSSIIYLPSKRK
jgi:hypothetical protein